MNLNIKYFYDKYVDEGGKLSYFAFRDLIIAHSKEMINECIKSGNEWTFRGGLGTLKVGRFKRKISVKDNVVRGSIDWKESNKLKEKILSQGKTPLVVERDDKGEKIGDNGGVPWLCYFTSEYCYRWIYSHHIYLKNGNKYKFVPSWGNSRKLSGSIDDNSVLLYKSLDKK